MADDDGMERELPIPNIPLPSQHHGLGLQFQQDEEPAQATEDDDGQIDGDQTDDDMDMDDILLDTEDFTDSDDGRGDDAMDMGNDQLEESSGLEFDDDLDEEMLDDDQQGPSMPILVELVLAAATRSMGFDFEIRVTSVPSLGGGYSNGGFGAVPASAAAVAGLQKKVFRAGKRDGAAEGSGAGAGATTTTTTSCSICFEEFEEGEEVSVMPCSSGHEFHPPCIYRWLGISNMCPLCRHELPTDG